MRLLKAVIFYLVIGLLLWVIILNFKHLASFNHWFEFIEFAILLLLCILAYSRAFLIDKSIRAQKEKEIVPFYIFLFDTPRMRFFLLFFFVKPYYTVSSGYFETVRKKINLMAYIIYFLLLAMILLTI